MTTKAMPALHLAVSRQDPRAVRRLLLSGANVDELDEDGRTALLRAIEIPEIVALLLDAGANARVSYDGKCALYRATCIGCYESVRLLLQRVALRCCDGEAPHSTLLFRTLCNMDRDDIQAPVYERIASLLLAARAKRFCPVPESNAFQLSANPRWFAARQKGAIEAEAFQLYRKRMADICIALQSQDLPALLTVLILRATYGSLGFRHCWEVVTKVKHFFD